MTREIRELLNKRAEKIKQAEQLNGEGKFKEAKVLLDEIQSLNDEIENMKVLDAEAGRFDNLDDEMIKLADKLKNNKQNIEMMSKLQKITSSREYHKAFIEALTSGLTLKEAMRDDKYAILKNALSETGGVPAGSEGGFLLPVDFDNMIWDLRRQHVALADYVYIENVIALSGWRARTKIDDYTGFALMSELTDMDEANAPQFVRIDYSVKDYGGFIPVAADLIDDTGVNLMQFLARWMAKKSVSTENTLIKAKLDTLVAKTFDVTSGKGLTSLKTALNIDLDPAISARAVILTNQSGFNFLDQLQDTTNRDLLQPDPTSPTNKMLKGRSVVVLSNAELANRVVTGTPDEIYAPIYIGDGTEYIDLFRRMPFEMATTNIGGNAWRQNSIEARGIMRLDAQVIDDAAMVKYEIKIQ